MDISERQALILERIETLGAVGVEELARDFAMTSQTIRTDLRDLGARGLVARTHGGARRLASAASGSYAERRAVKGEQKRRMGEVAARLIPDHASVTLNIGTTTEMVAHTLTGHSGLLVLSNNVNVINILIGSPARELVLVGGTVRPTDGAIVGSDAVEFIERYKVDVAVIGASALDADGAVLDFDAREVAVARAILRNARRRILVCDASKFAVSAPVRICGVGDLDHVVTDAPPPAEFARAAEAGGCEILIVGECDD
jgi:DeoR family glycerol-3-phosphate regulon repressor